MDTSHFLSAIAHGSIIFCVFFDRETYVLASLPPIENLDKLLVADLDARFVICLCLSMCALLLELFFYFYLIHPPPLAFFALILHAIACLTLLKFVVDEHPTKHFWLAFWLFNCPQLVCQFYLFVVENCCKRRTKWKLC